MTRSLLALLGLALAGCGSTAPGPPVDPDLHVLFIGNSLTYTHDVPALVARVSGVGGAPEVIVSSVTFGNYSLEDHWNDGGALEAIDRGGWDYVVLQQGPSAASASRAHLIEWSVRFADRIRAAGARPALYMVWPDGDDWDGVIVSYTEAAAAAEGLLLPAGRAFRAMVEDHPGIQLFAPDGFHPSLAGSYLAALTIYGALVRRSVAGTTLLRPIDGVSQIQARTLEDVADRINGFSDP